MRLILSLLLGILALVACSPAAPTTDQPASTERPTSAAGDDFRADNVEWVATSDKPQLIEVFSYS